ncbi:MAG: ABC transporter ATP-binding protein [Gammaproteobacteria bacterium]
MDKTGALPVSVCGIRKTYGDVCALNAVDLEVRAGEFLTLLGPSGSGKTTLLMVLAGFIRPDCGGVRFGGKEMVLTPPHKRNVGMVFQNYALFPHMDVEGNVAYPLKLRGKNKNEIAERTARALATVQLEGFARRRVHQLSGGQKQRVALARAIVFEPRILLMDEPLSALDKKLREQMQTELRALHESLGMTTVYVTHDQREALTMSDRIAVINGGNVEQLGAPREIYDRPKNPFVADFIGESALLPVRAQNGEIRRNGAPLSSADSPPDGEYLLLLRPEWLEIAEGETGEDNIFSGAITSSSYQGETVMLQITLDGGENIGARISPQDAEKALAPESGGRIALRLRRTRAVLIPRGA